MKKSISKRLRVTKRGKTMRREMSQDHCRAKKSGKQIRNKRKGLHLHATNVRVFRRHL